MLGAAGSAIALHVLYGLPWFGSPFADILLAFGVQINGGAFAGRQHHHTHDALAIDQ